LTGGRSIFGTKNTRDSATKALTLPTKMNVQRQ
jgi:hypothetical protein